MAGVPNIMQVTPVDAENNLFRITDVFPDNIVQLVKDTDWSNVKWQRQEGQESWKRRRLDDSTIPWIDQWHNHLRSVWAQIEKGLGISTQGYGGTAFWLDEPGFTCALHTDGELPGSLHLTWKGPGTTFYWYKDPSTVRYQVPEQPNAGYIMINQESQEGYRKLLWHAMLTPVPADSFRLTTYTWIIPK
jgi:hypothetical protein